MKLCGFEAGLDKPFFLIAGPCVIESLQLGKMRALLETMMALDAATKRAGVLENQLQD